MTVVGWVCSAWTWLVTAAHFRRRVLCPSRHDLCLARIAELERELFPLEALSEAEFDYVVAAASAKAALTEAEFNYAANCAVAAAMSCQAETEQRKMTPPDHEAAMRRAAGDLWRAHMARVPAVGHRPQMGLSRDPWARR